MSTSNSAPRVSPPHRQPAVVLGGAGAALSITRSLGRIGVPVYVLGDARGSLAGASRYCAGFVDTGDDDDVAERWLNWLRTGPRGAVVVACGDDGLSLVATHSELLRRWGLFPVETAGEASLAMLDKEQTYAIARRADVLAPRIWRVKARGELREIADELTFPCALKPLHSHRFARHFDFKVFVAQTLQDLERALSETSAHGLEMLITEIVPGGDDRVWSFSTYLDEEARPLFRLTRHKLRCYPIHFGAGTYHVTAWDAEVAAMGMRFLEGAGLRGMAHVEFKRDARDGRLKLIECNHRFVNANEVLRRAGIDVAVLAYLRALGQPAQGGEWRTGVHLWSPARDFRAARDMRSEGTITWPRWARSLLRHPLYLTVLSKDDLRPSAANVLRRARNRLGALSRVRRRGAAA